MFYVRVDGVRLLEKLSLEYTVQTPYGIRGIGNGAKGHSCEGG